MTWQAVARKDVQDAIRSYWLWGLSVVFVLLYGLVMAFIPSLQLLALVNTFLLPLTAIVMAYASVVGERESGSIKLLLSLPHSRFDVVVGKLFGRGVVVVVPVLLGFVVAFFTLLLSGIDFDAGVVVAFAIYSAILALAFVGLSVGISAAAGSGRQAMIGTVGLYVLLLPPVWNALATEVVRRVGEVVGLQGISMVRAQLLAKFIDPLVAYDSLRQTLTAPETVNIANTTVAGTNYVRAGIVSDGSIQGQLNHQIYARTLGMDVPFYLTDWFLVLVMIAVTVLVPLAGYWAFERADL